MCSSLVELVEVLRDTAAKAALADPGLLSDAEVRELAEAMQTVRNLVDAVDVAVVSAFEARGIADLDGLRTAQWLAHSTQVPKADALRRVRMALSLRRLPAVQAAFTSGALGRPQVEAIVHLHGGRTAATCEEQEELLTEKALELGHEAFGQFLRAWKYAADPDGPTPDDRDRRFDLSRGWDGEWHGTLVSPAETGAELDAALAAFEQREFQRDWDEARVLHGADACAHHLRRTASQRRHDALLAMARRACGNPDGTREPKPLVNVVVTRQAFERHLAHAAGLPVDPIDPASAEEHACRLADGTPITGQKLIQLALRGVVQRVVLDSPSVVTDVGRPQRLYTGPLRRAILSVVPYCTFPGCDTPATRCEVDHRHRWADGGRTTPENGAALCDRHQKLKEHGFTDRRDPDGTWTWHRPDGSRLE